MFAPRKSDTQTNGSGSHDNDRAYSSQGYPAPNQAISVSTRAKEANYSIINEWLKMKGDLESEGDVLVKGKVFGNIKCNLLIIDVDALVEGGITADRWWFAARPKA
jgi:predicted acyltransferase (DUF342 family)